MTAYHPLRIAIIGSGPSAFYTAEYLLKHSDNDIEIDMFERLPTPFGLVRGGVAPDHPKIKSVTRVYDRTASHPDFRFYGNIEIGRDIQHNDLVQHYHVIIYATGAQTDRPLDIPGANLAGSHAATEFVGWYNGHPDYRDLKFDLSQERVAIIGNGNVAMDVARIMARTADELRETDIADYALDALNNSRIKEIFILGRRGPVHAKFTNAEMKELETLTGANVIVLPEDLELDPLSQEYLLSGEDHNAERNYQTLTYFAQHRTHDKPKDLILRFLVSPVEFLGTDRLEAIRLVKNEICVREHFMAPCPTEEFEVLPLGLVFRSIGYRGVPLPGVPFDPKNGIIPNVGGRIIDLTSQPRVGEYAVGWIKRGPTGIIGTNKPDAQETASLVLEDVTSGKTLDPADPSRDAVEAMLHARGLRYVTYEDWQILDRIEQEQGRALGRPRLKFSRVETMLAALEEYKTPEVAS